jgi:hypothetical protein
MDERKQELLYLKESVFENQSVWNRKYLHFKTVSNFIHHFDNIKNENDKRWIFKSLNDYLINCDDLKEEINRTESNTLFESFLAKPGDYYRHELHFKMVMNKVSYFFLYSVAFIGMALIFNFYIALLIIPLIIYHQYRVRLKVKRRETYGVFY